MDVVSTDAPSLGRMASDDLLIDTLGVSLEARYIRSEDNDLADALSRGSPFDELRLRTQTWHELEERHGPHTIDRYARFDNTRLPRWNSRAPHPQSAAAGALSQRWAGENSYAFPPPTELPQLAQLLAETPRAAATVITPFWPAQAWYQRLTTLATSIEVRGVAQMARPPPALHASGRHALSAAMLTTFRVPVRQV